MPNIRSSGIFAGDASGQYRGTYLASSKTKVPGAPIDHLARQQWRSHYADFMYSTDLTDLTVTDVGTVTDETIAAEATGENYGLFTHNVANEGFSIQNTLLAFKPTAGQIITFEANVYNTDWTESDWAIGLGEVDTTILASTGVLTANNADNCALFHSLDTSAVVNMSSAAVQFADIVLAETGAGVNNVGQTLSAPTLVDAEYTRFGIRIEGVNSIEYYMDGLLVHTVELAADLAELLVPSFGMLAGGSENALRIDYYYVGGTRT